MIDDEVWKDVSILGQGRGIAGKESEQHNPEKEKEEKLWYDNNAAADNGAAAFFLAPTRQEALSNGLVCSMSCHAEEAATDKSGKHSVINAEVEDAEVKHL